MIVDPVSIGPIETVRELYDEGYYVQAEVQRALNEYFEGLNEDAPIGSVTELYESELYACDIAESIEAAAEAPIETFEEDFRENVGRRSELREMIVETMAEHDLDAILYPSKSLPPIRIDNGPSGSRLTLSPNANTPAISVPAGFTEDEGLPVGLELLGRQFDEPKLLQLAYAFEQGTDHREPPAEFGPLPEEPPEVPEEYDVSIAVDGCE
jgi:amidase